MTLDRRSFLTACSHVGIASPLLPGILYTLAAQAQEPSTDTDQSKPPKITPEMIDQAAVLAGLGPFTAEQKQMMIDGLVDNNGSYKAIRKLNLPNSVPPAYVFHPMPAGADSARFNFVEDVSLPLPPETVPEAPANIEDLAFATVSELAGLIRTRKITSLALTQMYLARLKRYDSKLHFVISLTEERALAQAKAADDEIAGGKYRGPLHGIPWGAKDLLAVKGYPTTWGAGGFEHQSFDEDATVVQRLDAAGAVLVAKFTLGALAMGDKWFGGRTRNPWNPNQGSSGSSAGSASAVAAGCVAFAIGSETLGSISFALHALRRHWPAANVRLCAPHRRDGPQLDHGQAGPDQLAPPKIAPSYSRQSMAPTAKTFPSRRQASTWNPTLDWHKLRIGYLKSEFDEPKSPSKPSRTASERNLRGKERTREKHEAEQTAARIRREYDRRYDLAALEKLRAMGMNLIPVELPKLPYGAMVPLLTAEAAAAFDDLTLIWPRSSLLTEQGIEDWPNDFRVARFYPAVEYIQANRARTLAIQQVSALFE